MSEEKKQNILERKVFKVVPIISLIGIVVGAIGGYIYYLEVGCNGGT